jgi:hypothetical protein
MSTTTPAHSYWTESIRVSVRSAIQPLLRSPPASPSTCLTTRPWLTRPVSPMRRARRGLPDRIFAPFGESQCDPGMYPPTGISGCHSRESISHAVSAEALKKDYDKYPESNLIDVILKVSSAVLTGITAAPHPSRHSLRLVRRARSSSSSEKTLRRTVSINSHALPKKIYLKRINPIITLSSYSAPFTQESPTLPSKTLYSITDSATTSSLGSAAQRP